tara:strand:+ start:99 stop:1544 length:1446 start_codon:yes stop_codon:yes gene_type:complete
MKTLKEIYHRPMESPYIPYGVYCTLLDYIGENYHILNEETFAEDWWSDLTSDEQSKYIKGHPDSDKAKNARERGDGDKDKKPSLKDKVKSLFSKEKTQAALKDLKSHVDSVVKSVGVDAKLVTKAFKEPSVYNTVNALGGSISAAVKTTRGLMQGAGKALEVGGAALTDTPGFDKLQKGMISADEWLEKNPKAKKIAGVGLAAAATAQWWYMSFSGDVESDFDLASVAAAVTGKPVDDIPSITDFLGTPAGVKNMALLGGGLAGESLIGTAGWAALGSTGIGLGIALTYAGLKWAGETEAGKKVKAKMVEMGKEAQDKIQKGAKALDKKLGNQSATALPADSPFKGKSEEVNKDMKTFKEVYELCEIMSVATRKKMARRMAKMAKSTVTQMKKKRAALRIRNPAKLLQLARKKTIQSYRDKFFSGYKDMAPQQKVKIDQTVMQKYGKKIDKISKKVAKKLQKAEVERVKKAKAAQKKAQDA